MLYVNLIKNAGNITIEADTDVKLTGKVGQSLINNYIYKIPTLTLLSNVTIYDYIAVVNNIQFNTVITVDNTELRITNSSNRGRNSSVTTTNNNVGLYTIPWCKEETGYFKSSYDSYTAGLSGNAQLRDHSVSTMSVFSLNTVGTATWNYLTEVACSWDITYAPNVNTQYLLTYSEIQPDAATENTFIGEYITDKAALNHTIIAQYVGANDLVITDTPKTIYVSPTSRGENNYQPLFEYFNYQYKIDTPTITAVNNSDALGEISYTFTPVQKAAKYIIEYSTSETFEQLTSSSIEQTVANTAYNITGLQPGIKYYIRIKAVVAEEFSHNFIDSDWCVIDVTATSDITNVTLSANLTVLTVKRVTLTVTPSDWPSSYTIYRKLFTEEDSAFAIIATTAQNTYTDDTLDWDTSYTYKVVCTNDSSNGFLHGTKTTNTLKITVVDKPRLTAPTLTATKINTTSALLQRTKPLNSNNTFENTKQFILQYSTSSTFASDVTTITDTQNFSVVGGVYTFTPSFVDPYTFTIPNLPEGTTYYARCMAIPFDFVWFIESVWSDTETFTTHIQLDPCTLVVNSSLTSVNNTSIMVTKGANNNQDTVQEYIVERSTNYNVASGAGTWSTIQSYSNIDNVVILEDSGLLANSDCYYRVKAIAKQNTLYESSISQVDGITTRKPLGDATLEIEVLGQDSLRFRVATYTAGTSNVVCQINNHTYTFSTSTAHDNDTVELTNPDVEYVYYTTWIKLTGLVKYSKYAMTQYSTSNGTEYTVANMPKVTYVQLELRDYYYIGNDTTGSFITPSDWSNYRNGAAVRNIPTINDSNFHIEKPVTLTDFATYTTSYPNELIALDNVTIKTRGNVYVRNVIIPNTAHDLIVELIDEGTHILQIME